MFKLATSILGQTHRKLISRTMCSSVNNLNVKVEQGIVAGALEHLPNGNPMFVFKGIPYAETPERFMPPKKLQKFQVPVLDCTSERNICFQKNTFGEGFIGSEDCLFLNVYTPKLKTPEKLPVMIFIHGGAFQWGSGDSDFYSPEFMVQENVIIVTLNYRLHALGFSCLPGGGIHANVGLKDQLLGIKWVKENISQFNGDPENITLFSESAGAASCHMHVLSKNSRRYFKRAICQSGSAFGDWAFKKDVEQKTRLLGKSLGCKGKTDQEIFETLKHADLEELNLHCMKILSADEKRRTLPFIFKPTFEVDSEDAIITKSPLQLIKDQKDEIKIDIMFGTNDRDGMIMIMDAVKKLDAYDNDPVRFIPTSVNINPMSPNAEALGQEIKKFYFGDEGVCKETIPKLADLMTDFHFKLSDNLSTELHARYQNCAKTFVYDFAFDGKMNMFKKFFQLNVPGACHADELFYLFQMKIFPVELEENCPEIDMRKTMCKLWTNFAKYGDPTPDGENPLPFKWNPVKNVDPSAKNVDIDCLRIDRECRMLRNPYKERLDFWKNVYRQWNENFLNPKL